VRRRLEKYIRIYSIGYQIFCYTNLIFLHYHVLNTNIFNMNKLTQDKSLKRIASFEPREQIMDTQTNNHQLTVCIKLIIR
jgi:hypothetical protein